MSLAAQYARTVSERARAEEEIKRLSENATAYYADPKWVDLRKPPSLIFSDGSVYNPTTGEYA